MPIKVDHVSHGLCRRALTVSRVITITPGVKRIHLAGRDLDGFESLSPDDHVRLFFPDSFGDCHRRDYTPRLHKPADNEIVIDFALHGGGPATQWARGARCGNTIEICGPKMSTMVAYDFDWCLLVGDEAALPAIGRRLEELPPGVAVTTVVAVTSASEQQVFQTVARHRAIWVHRPLDQADDAARLLAALAWVRFPPSDGFVWIAAESNVARSAYAFIAALGSPKLRTMASAYWRKGVPNVQGRIGP